MGQTLSIHSPSLEVVRHTRHGDQLVGSYLHTAHERLAILQAAAPVMVRS